ncbi:titin-like isoform X2 [Dermatophagoides pteronyssinus]|uniref:titin-like isoform X2 n=1 Tax=Dermatophagoides pteronyssinus TaxID=6956 RepID=UPI003F66DA86
MTVEEVIKLKPSVVEEPEEEEETVQQVIRLKKPKDEESTDETIATVIKLKKEKPEEQPDEVSAEKIIKISPQVEEEEVEKPKEIEETKPEEEEEEMKKPKKVIRRKSSVKTPITDEKIESKIQVEKPLVEDVIEQPEPKQPEKSKKIIRRKSSVKLEEKPKEEKPKEEKPEEIISTVDIETTKRIPSKDLPESKETTETLTKEDKGMTEEVKIVDEKTTDIIESKAEEPKKIDEKKLVTKPPMKPPIDEDIVKPDEPKLTEKPKKMKLKRKESVKPEKPKEDETVEETIKLEKPKEKPEETIDEIVRLKKKPEEKPDEETTVEKVVRLGKPDEEEEEQSALHTIKLAKPKQEQPDEESVEETIKFIRPKVNDEASAEATLEISTKEYDEISTEIIIKRKSKKSKEPKIIDSDEVTVKLPGKPKKYSFSEASAELKITKKIDISVDDLVVDDVTVIEEIVDRRKPRKEESEEEESEKSDEEEELQPKVEMPEESDEERSSVKSESEAEEEEKEGDEISETFRIRKPKADETVDEEVELRLRKPKPEFEDEEESGVKETVTLIKQVEDIVEIEEQVIRLKKKPSQESETEESLSEIIRLKKQAEEEEETIAQLIKLKRKSKTDEADEELIEETFRLTKPEFDEQSAFASLDITKTIEYDGGGEDISTEILIKKQAKKSKTSDEISDESYTLTMPTKTKPEQGFDEASAELKLKIESKIDQHLLESKMIEEMISKFSVTSEIPNVMSLRQGDRIYVVERVNQDWWFVRKKITKEFGFVPAEFLTDETSYTLYLDDTLKEFMETEEQVAEHILIKKKSPEIIDGPDEMIKVESGQSLILNFKFEGSFPMHFVCFKDQRPLQPDSRIKLFCDENNQLHLYFDEVYSFDTGTYSIVMKNMAGSTKQTFTLEADGQMSFMNEEIYFHNLPFKDDEQPKNVPLFSKFDDNIEINMNEPFNIEFTVYSFEKPRLKLTKNGRIIYSTDKFNIEHLETNEYFHHYRIQCLKTDENDDGPYEICAQNLDGENQTKFNVVYKEKIEKPTFTKRFRSTKLQEGNQLLLETTVKGYPQPIIKWYYNDDHILPSSKCLIRQHKNDGTLAINNLIKSLHEGRYKVVARNQYGECQYEEQIEVIRKIPKFLERLNDIEVYENEKTFLSVKITTKEDDVVWLKEGEPIDPIDNNDDYQMIKDGHYRKLLIKKAKVSHQGEYTCVLEQDKCTGYLEVIELPAEILKDLKDCNVKYGDKAQFIVEVSKGDAILQWFKNKSPISFDDRIYLDIDGKQQTLSIEDTKLEDIGEYSCLLNQQTSKARLLVSYPSTEFLKRLDDEYWIDENCETIFTVEISRSDVDVFWYHNGEELIETSNIKMISDGTIRKLIIHHTRMTDMGEYICMAKGDQTETQLNVSKEPLVFLLKLKDFNVNEGETATLSVEVIDENLDIVWMKDDQIIEPDGNRMMISTIGKHKKLIIKNVNVQDRGYYTAICNGQRSTGKLSVLTPPKVLTDTRRFTAVRGENFSLDISYEGYPSPKAEWYHSGKIIKTSKKSSVEIMMSRTILTIKNFDDDDIGLYKLSLENSIGQYITHFELFIIDKPDPPSRPEPMNITNNSLILVWQSPKKDNGSPVSNYLVEYKELKAKNWKEYNEFINEQHVKIRNLKHSICYVFRVYAINKAGKSLPSMESEPVIMEEQDLQMAPTFIQPLPSVMRTQPFATTTFECKSIGNPLPNIEWYHNDEQIDENNDNIIIKYDQQHSSSTLIIKECSFEWSGNYKCIARNNLGEAITRTKLLVEEKPYARFNNDAILAKIKQGNEHLIECEIYGFPEPEINWYKGALKLRNTMNILIDNNEKGTTKLLIKNFSFEDAGIYTLHLINSAGERKYDFELRMLKRPGPPEQPIRCVPGGENSIELSWNPPKDDGGSSILFYLIEKYETRMGKEWIEVTQVNGNEFSHTIRHLIAGLRYKFRVSSINEFGISDPAMTESVLCRKILERPSPPTGPIKTSDHTESSFNLHWNPPEYDGNSSLIEYLIETRESNDDESINVQEWRKSSTVDGETLTAKIENLEKEKTYELRITCRNEIGWSDPYYPETKITVKCRYGPPTPPIGPLELNEMTNASLRIVWKPPLSNGGLELTNYIIERKLTFENTWIREAIVNPDQLSYTIQNLSSKYEYNIRVLAENALGQSDPLESEYPVQLCKDATPPGIPTAPLEMRSVSPSAIMIEWGKPEYDGGSPITGYVIAAKDARRTMWIQVGKVDSTVHRLQIKDFQENRSYKIRVMAENEIGLSDPLESEEPITVIRPPGFEEQEAEREHLERDDTLSLSFTTSETTSWMREANVEARVESYTVHSLLKRKEYFFSLWVNADKLFK